MIKNSGSDQSVYALSRSFFAIMALVSSFHAAHGQENRAAPAPVQTVSFVDVNQYLGTWYEIASNPQRFSEGCTCTQADYSIRSEGVLKVVNTCRDRSPTGRVRTANGRAYIQDTQSNAKLSVGFLLPFLPWFRGEYWIIDLAQDYSYAAVSNSKGSSLWILSRTRQMDPQTYAEILERVSQQVSVDNLVLQEQSGCN
jgi:apolipoprotein D and lipocalin family protein